MCGSPNIPPPAPAPDHYAEEQARIAREKAEREAKAAEARTAATSVARNQAEAEATRRGLNPADYQSIIDREISEILGLIPSDELTPASYFTNFGPNVFAEEEGALRNKTIADINRVAPTGFERTRTPDSIVDPIIESIIGEQYGSTKQQLEAARARGQLTDMGFGSALSQLDTRRGGARAQFDPITSSVLEGVRGAQRDYVGTQREAAGNLQLGQNFDLAGFETGLGEVEAREEGAVPGRIRSLGPSSLFNIGELLNLGGQAQGPQNAPIIATPRDQQRRDQKRGLGSTGAF